MEEGFVDVALLYNTESFKSTDFGFVYDSVDINDSLVNLVNAKILQTDNYFKRFTLDSSSIQLKYWYSDVMRMTELKPSHMMILCTACVGMTFTLKLLWLGVTKPLSPTRFLIIDLLSNGNNLLEFIAQVILYLFIFSNKFILTLSSGFQQRSFKSQTRVASIRDIQEMDDVLCSNRRVRIQ